MMDNKTGDESMCAADKKTRLADLLLADIANVRALVRLIERGRKLIRCRKCWLGFVLPTTKKERDGVIRKAVRHYRTHTS
jgi:hypothetical protein